MQQFQKIDKSQIFILRFVFAVVSLIFFSEAQSPINLAINGRLNVPTSITQFPYCTNGLYGWWADLDSQLQIYQGPAFNSNQNVLVLDNSFHKSAITSFEANGNSFTLSFNCTLSENAPLSTNSQNILKIYKNQMLLTQIILINTSRKKVQLNLTNVSNGLNEIKFVIDDNGINQIGITGLEIYNTNQITTNSSTTPTPPPINPAILDKMFYMTSLNSLSERAINFDTIIINYQNFVPKNLTVQSIFVLFFFRTGDCGGDQREFTFTIRDTQSSFTKWLKGYCYSQYAWSYLNQQFEIPANGQRQFFISLSTKLSGSTKMGVYLTGYKLA